MAAREDREAWMSGDRSYSGIDPFMRFWTDLMSKMTAAGVTPPHPSQDLMQQLRRAYFDALAEQADQFLRSETFLNAMKQGMESSLAWQQAINQFLQKGLATAQIPSRADAEQLVVLLRGMEERVLDRIEDLSRRVATLESARGGSMRRPKPAPKRKPGTRAGAK
jgi:hypothetical protein